MILEGLQFKRGTKICIQLNGIKQNLNTMYMRQNLAWKNILDRIDLLKLNSLIQLLLIECLLGARSRDTALLIKGHQYLLVSLLTILQHTGQRMEIVLALELEKTELNPCQLVIRWLGQVIYNLLAAEITGPSLILSFNLILHIVH